MFAVFDDRQYSGLHSMVVKSHAEAYFLLCKNKAASMNRYNSIQNQQDEGYTQYHT